MDKITRAEFFKRGSTFALSISALGYYHPSPEEYTSDCLTTEDILGPFYRPGAPLRTNMRMSEDTGAPLVVAGTVYGDDCITPLPGASIEVWQADGAGSYDNDSDSYRYRSRLNAGEYGKYTFKTNVPGKYLNGSRLRPSHLHFRVTADSHRDLISQIYFKDDPEIAADPWASSPAAELRILPVEELKAGEKSVQFDIYLVAS